MILVCYNFRAIIRFTNSQNADATPPLCAGRPVKTENPGIMIQEITSLTDDYFEANLSLIEDPSTNLKEWACCFGSVEL